jgi:hypothetical protein
MWNPYSSRGPWSYLLGYLWMEGKFLVEVAIGNYSKKITHLISHEPQGNMNYCHLRKSFA